MAVHVGGAAFTPAVGAVEVSAAIGSTLVHDARALATPSGTVWDATFNNVDMTFSADGKTVTADATMSWKFARTDLSRSGGKVYFEVRVVADVGNNSGFIGASAATTSDGSGGASEFKGEKGLVVRGSGQIAAGGSTAGYVGPKTMETGDVYGFALDLDTGKGSVRVNGSAFETAIDAHDIAGSAPWHIYAHAREGGAFELLTTAAQMTMPIPAGYSAWDA